jgi:SWI/SNF-related matrix-associated actin-dependent regulator 1 of chromatin subfamily A
MYPYQQEGVAYNLAHKRTIIGDEPGLGKTLQSIATIVAAEAFPCLVICPSSLKLNWQREWEKWTGRKYAMILEDGLQRNYHLYYESGMIKVFIVNYESLKKYFVRSIDKGEAKALRLNHIKFDERISMFRSVIIDELHRCKDLKTQQAKFVKGITDKKEYILGLTGTPVINKPKDLISQLGIIGALGYFGGYQKFIDKYCAGLREASNLKELNYNLNKYCFYRREKKQVLKDLPDKMRQVVSCQITNRKEYADAESNLMEYLRSYKAASDDKIASAMRGQIMVRIGILKNISARGKLADVFEYIADVIDSGEKLIVFGHLKEVIAAIKQRFPTGTVSITGDDDNRARQAAVDAFQSDPHCKLIVCSIKAAGVGLTLTASSRVAFVEFPWHSADCDQCEDRAHRIGQKDSVQVTYFLGKDTIDGHIFNIIEKKRAIAKAVTGSNEDITIDFVNEIANLFNKPI